MQQFQKFFSQDPLCPRKGGAKAAIQVTSTRKGPVRKCRLPEGGFHRAHHTDQIDGRAVPAPEIPVQGPDSRRLIAMQQGRHGSRSGAVCSGNANPGGPSEPAQKLRWRLCLPSGWWLAICVWAP